MYINITAQKLGTNYSQSSADFVDYLEKENGGLTKEDMEHFFNQYGNEISAKEVIKEIDGNTAKLKKKEPKFALDYHLLLKRNKLQKQAMVGSEKYR